MTDPSVRSAYWFLALDCILATAVRVTLAWFTGGYRTDVLTFQSWAGTLRSQPLDRFYESAVSPDHLPGDLWLLKGMSWLYTAFGGNNVYGRTFGFLTQMVPTLGDLLSAIMLFLIVRRIADDGSASRATRWYLLNPATILLTGVWGQWDSVSLALLLTGLWLLLRNGAEWLASAPFLAWALLVKPQLVLAALCFLPLVWQHLAKSRRPSPRDWLRSMGGATAWVVAGVVTAYLVLLPFGVHLLRASVGESTLLQRVRGALDLYPFTTVGAANVWMLPIASLKRVRDDTPGLLSLSTQTWGQILLTVALIVLATGWLTRLRRPKSAAVVAWAATAAVFAGFMLTTRMHERYALPVLGLGLVLLGTQSRDRHLMAWFWLVSCCLALNQVLVLYGGIRSPLGNRVHFGAVWWLGLSIVYVTLFVWLLSRPWWSVIQRGVGASSKT